MGPVTLSVDGLPPLSWTHEEGRARWDATAGELALTATGGTDWINDALGAARPPAATSLGFPVTGDCTLAARVRVDGPRTTFDAGVLALWSDAEHWAKLCFECSPQGEEMVVSVVTDGYSDDSNGPLVTAGEVHLRVARVGPAWAFHRSTDGRRWEFVRVFRLPVTGPVSLGFLAQAPQGPGATARFDQIRYAPGTLTDLRDGS